MRVIHCAVGAISESDVMLATTSNAIIVGFNVRPDNNAKESAARNNVDMRMYRVIYDCINEIETAMKGMLAPKFKEVELGQAEVRNVFRITGVGMVAGCYVTNGKMQRGAQMRLLRDNIVIYDGAIASLQRFKDSVKEVAQGYECGITFEKFQDIKEGDVIEAYLMEQMGGDPSPPGGPPPPRPAGASPKNFPPGKFSSRCGGADRGINAARVTRRRRGGAFAPHKRFGRQPKTLAQGAIDSPRACGIIRAPRD